MRSAELLVVLILAVWFFLAALVQIRLPWIQAIRRWDPFDLLPMWWFFAPQAPKGDFFLLYRHIGSDQTATDWREVVVGGERPYWAFLLNPGRRERKALFDICSALAGVALEEPEEDIPDSVPYLALLNHVSALPKNETSRQIQFMLMQSSLAATPTDQPQYETLFLSPFHRL